MNFDEFLNKIDYEGGIAEAFCGYGLTVEDLEVDELDKSDLKDCIEKLTEAYRNLESLIEELTGVYSDNEEG